MKPKIRPSEPMPWMVVAPRPMLPAVERWLSSWKACELWVLVVLGSGGSWLYWLRGPVRRLRFGKMLPRRGAVGLSGLMSKVGARK